VAIIFLSGVHGVGKTTISKKLSAELSIQWFSSSSLIKEHNNELIASCTKNVKDISNNQDALINSVCKLKNKYENFILEGHATLLNSEGKVILLNSEIFKSLGVNSIVALFVSPRIIYERLFLRDGHSPAIHKIIRHQKFEILNSKKISHDIGVDFSIHNSFDMHSIANAIKKSYKRGCRVV